MGTLKDHLLVKLNDMAANGIELLCVSADPLDVATKYAADHVRTVLSGAAECLTDAPLLPRFRSPLAASDISHRRWLDVR